MRKALPALAVIFMFVLGIGVLFYPDIASWYNAQIQQGVGQAYNEQVALMQDAHIEEEFRRAEEYNEALNGGAIQDPFVLGSGAVLPPAEYLSILNISGMIGRIRVPRLDIDLPIYHTTSHSVLNRGVGHLEGTSFPVGGAGTHSVLAGHSGLAHSRLFTDLLESHAGIEIGDQFFIQVLDRTLAYQVDEINTVLPHEIETLRIDREADFVTLLTCSPYTINSHRLLVRGVRVPYTPGMAYEIEVFTQSAIDFRMLIIIAFVVLFLLALIIYKIRESQKDKARERELLERIRRAERLRYR